MGLVHVIAALVALLTLGARGYQLSHRGLFWDDLVIPSFFSGFNPVGSNGDTSNPTSNPSSHPTLLQSADSDSARFAAEQLSTAVGKTAPHTGSPILERLFNSYDGHLIPGSAALQMAVAHIAPLSWWLPALVIFLATALSTLVWFLVMRKAINLGAHPGLALLIFTALTTSPFLSATTGWWSAAINALAWQLAAAGIVLVGLHPRIQPIALTLALTGIEFIALLFTEKALGLIALMIAVVWIRSATATHRQPHRVAPLYGALLVPAILTAVWTMLYLSIVGPTPQHPGFAITSAIPHALVTLIIPALVGGPWEWERWHPGSPFAALPWGIGLAITLLLLAGAAFAISRTFRSSTHSSRIHSHHPTRRAITVFGAALLCSAAYLSLVLFLMIRARTSTGTTDLLPRTPHYYADWWSFTLVLLLLAGIGLAPHSTVTDVASTRRPPLIPFLRFSAGRGATIAATLLAVSASISTITWTATWRDDTSREYLANLRSSVVEPYEQGKLAPLLNQPVRIDVLNPLLHPFNSVNSITGVPVATHTTQPKVVNDEGQLVDADVLHVASNPQGKEPQCGTRIEAGKPQIVLLDKPVPFGDWTWEFNAAATRDAKVKISMPNGLQSASEVAKRAVTVPVGTNPQTQWVRINGVGGTMAVEVIGPEGTSLCLGAGAIGPLLPAQKPARVPKQ